MKERGFRARTEIDGQDVLGLECGEKHRQESAQARTAVAEEGLSESSLLFLAHLLYIVVEGHVNIVNRTIHMGNRADIDMTIVGNMTILAKEFWKGMIEGTSHPLPCFCDLCLYASYRNKPGKGRPFGRQTFFVNWLIHQAKIEHLLKTNKAQEVRTPEGKRWTCRISDYDGAPALKHVKETIEELCMDEGLKDISSDLEKLALYVAKSRSERKIFVKLLETLAVERRREWSEAQPNISKEVVEDQESHLLCKRIVEFIRSRPGQKATMRELERHFSNRRKVDLEAAFRWFFINPVIERRKRGKTIIFTWRRMTKAEIEAYNRRAEEQFRAE